MVECGSVDGEWFELVGGVRCSVGQWGEGLSVDRLGVWWGVGRLGGEWVGGAKIGAWFELVGGAKGGV